MERGIGTDDISQALCQDYSEEEIKNDREAIDYETAIEEVERIEE